MKLKRKSPPALLVLFVMLLSMTAGSLALNKVAPVLSEMMADLHITESSQGGMLISIFVFSGIFLTLPAGIISGRIGLYPTGIVALAAAAAGSMLGLLPLGYGFMLLSRAVEGVGLVVLATIGPIAVGRFFSGKKLASAMGCLMCFMALGQMIVLNLAPALSAAGSWRSVWWLSGGYAAVMLLVWILTMPGLDAAGEESSPAPSMLTGLKLALRNRNVLITSVILLCYLIAQQGCSGFLVSYLSESRGLDASAASRILSLSPAVGIPTGVVVGMVSDRVGSRKWPIAVLMLCAAACYWQMPHWPTASYGVLTFLWGVATMGVVGLCFSVVSAAAGEHGAMFTAVLNTVQWIGVFFSSVVFGMLKDRFGWNGAFGALVPLTVLAVLLAVFLQNNTSEGE